MVRIVVGVDGSKRALRALQWAAEEATLRGASLRVVCVHRVPLTSVPYREDVWDRLRRAEQEHADEVVREAVAAARAHAPEVTVEGETVEGPPAAMLLERAADADLIVVGSRGRGGFSGLLLGSVSQQVVHHATCPVVVLPPEH